MSEYAEINALLGHGTRYEGKLAFDGHVRIDGSFEGQVLSDGILIVGESGTVKGTVRVGALIVRGGTVEGEINAATTVELYAPGCLLGEVHAPELYIEKGATFDGQCTMPGSAVRDL